MGSQEGMLMEKLRDHDWEKQREKQLDMREVSLMGSQERMTMMDTYWEKQWDQQLEMRETPIMAARMGMQLVIFKDILWEIHLVHK